MINNFSLTDRLFEEEDHFLIYDNEVAKQRLQVKAIQKNMPRRTIEYLIELSAHKNRAVMRAFRILKRTKKGYKVVPVTDEKEFNEIDRIHGSRGWALPLTTEPTTSRKSPNYQVREQED